MGMLKRRIIVSLAALAALCGVLAVIIRPKPEPEYGGHKLSEWVVQLVKPTSMGSTTFVFGSWGTDIADAQKAIRQIGTNALPYLIEWIGYETPTWKTYVLPVATRILGTTRWAAAEQDRIHRRRGALYALQTLRPNAQQEIGNLSRIASDPKRSDSRPGAIS